MLEVYAYGRRRISFHACATLQKVELEAGVNEDSR